MVHLSYNDSSVTDKAYLTHWPLGDLNVFKNVIFTLALLIGIFKSPYDNVLRWMPQDLTDDKSKLVQVMAWCPQATSHYLNQCWPRPPTPYGVTGPQWVNHGEHRLHFSLFGFKRGCQLKICMEEIKVKILNCHANTCGPLGSNGMFLTHFPVTT